MSLEELEDRLLAAPEDFEALELLRQKAPRHPLCYEDPFPVEAHGFFMVRKLFLTMKADAAEGYFKGEEVFWENLPAGQELILRYHEGDILSVHVVDPERPELGFRVTSNAVMLTMPPVVLTGHFRATIPHAADLKVIRRADAEALASFYPVVSHFAEGQFENRYQELAYLQAHHFRVPVHGKIEPEDIKELFQEYRDLMSDADSRGLILHSPTRSAILEFER